MKKLIFLLVFNFFSVIIFSLDENKNFVLKNELGLDGFASFTNFGGSFGCGAKYAIVKDENFVFGPSVRIQRMWSNNFGQKYYFNIYGGGAFFHYRLKNTFFAGAEFEFLRSPFNYSYVYSVKTWVPTLFLGGGYSKEFEKSGLRLNAGVFYDIVDHVNSPFRSSYVLKNAQGVLIPVIYRIGVFIPIN